MHELSICQTLVSQVDAIAGERNARVSQVHVGIGPLSGVEPQLLQSAYPFACAGTRAEGSHLALEQADVRVRCRSCGAESSATPNRLLCGPCGDWHTDVVSGDELILLRVELETTDGEGGVPCV